MVRLNQWSSNFFVQSPRYRNFAEKSPPSHDFSVVNILFYFENNQIQ